MTTFTPAQMTTFTPAASNHAHAYRHSVPTLAAIGFLAYYVVVMCHEVLGQCSVLYARRAPFRLDLNVDRFI